MELIKKILRLTSELLLSFPHVSALGYRKYNDCNVTSNTRLPSTRSCELNCFIKSPTASNNTSKYDGLRLKTQSPKSPSLTRHSAKKNDEPLENVYDQEDDEDLVLSDVDKESELDSDEEYDEVGEDDDEYDESEDDALDAFDYNTRGELMIPGIHRFARTRASRNRRKLFRQDYMHLSSLVYPLFVHDKEESIDVPSVSGLRIYSLVDLVKEVGLSKQLGITTFIVYPFVNSELKTQFGDEALNQDGLLPRAIEAIKESFPDVQVIADTNVSYYTVDGHDGLVEPELNYISNDITVGQIAKQACVLADSGCDIVSVSDLMDGTVGVTRETLDYEGYTDVSIMSRAAKFNSVYSSYRNKILGIQPSLNVDTSSYLHDVSNFGDGIFKGVTDVENGADILAVEPATSFLDVIKGIKKKIKVPLVAVHTTGEYAAMKAASNAGVFDEKSAAIETVKSFKRAGSDLIVTHYAKDIATWLLDDMRANGVDHVNPKLCAGKLNNGLSYTILPNENHSGRFEAYLEVHSGSADEFDDQQGIAHFCEHVTYMGSRKRDDLIGKDVRTNAFTDFHHTVFYTSCPSLMENTKSKKESLEKALDTLLDVVEAPSQFNETRVEKERMAILSEASIINTMEYRKNCATVKALHSENRLSKRYPIGDLNMLKRYKVEDLTEYHKIHYRPSNLHLFVVGDIDTATAIECISNVFSKLRDSNNEQLNLIRDIYRGTVKELKRELPPAKHDWDQSGPLIHIWKNEQLNNVALEIVRKMPIPEIKTWRDLRNNILNKIVYRALALNFDILGRGSRLYESVEANDFDCINEGCRIRSLEIKSALDRWEKAMCTAVSHVKHFLMTGINDDLLQIVTDSIILDLNRLDGSKMENQDLISGVMDANSCGRVFMAPEYEKNAITEIIHNLHVDDVNELATTLFRWVNGKLNGIHLICSAPTKLDITEDSLTELFNQACESTFEGTSHTQIQVPSQLLLLAEKNNIVNKEIDGKRPDFLPTNPPKERIYDNLDLTKFSDDLFNVTHSYVDQIKESSCLLGEVEYIKAAKVDLSDRTKIESMVLERSRGLEGVEDGKYVSAMVDSSKPILSTLEPTAELYNATDPSFELLQLSNGLKVNIKIDDVQPTSIRTLVPLSYELDDVQELNRKKFNLLVAASAMMEGGAMGNLTRSEVEMFCSRHLLDVMISMNEDYFIIEMSFPFSRVKKNSNLESALQILHCLVQQHKIEPDAFSRGIDKIKRDRMQYLQDLQSFGVGDLLYSMSDEKLSFHTFDADLIDKVTLFDVQNTLSSIFTRGSVEVSICGNLDLDEIKPMIRDYLGTISLPEQNDKRSHYVMIPKTFLTGNSEDAITNGDASASTAYDQNKTVYIDDNQERAMVLLAGYAPNSSGILPDGTHMADLLEAALLNDTSVETALDRIRILAKTRKNLWLHPAFPKAASSLLQELLNNRTFTIVILEQTHKIIEDIRTNAVPFTAYHLDRAKHQVLSKMSKESKQPYYWVRRMSGLQLLEQPLKSLVSLTGFEGVLDRITVDDIRLLIASQAYGFSKDNLWSRIVHTNLNNTL